MGDTDFYGRVGELESLQDAYDSRTAEIAIIYGRRRIGKTALIQKFCEGKPAFFYTAKAWKDPYQLDRFHKLWEHFAEILNCAISSGLRHSEHLRLSRHRVAR